MGNLVWMAMILNLLQMKNFTYERYRSHEKCIKGKHFPITIVAIGPLTNIALLLATYPEIKSKIKQIVIMGGSSGRGNVTPLAEFNIYCDPEAANIVLTLNFLWL